MAHSESESLDAGNVKVPVAEPASGCVDGRFRIESILGRGATGSVYRVCELATGRQVALKRLHRVRSEGAATRDADPANAEPAENRADPAVVRFQREYHTLAQLRHPHIVQVFDYGLDAAGPYYTMELLAGEDLRALAPMGWRQTCEVLRDVASALAMLHAKRRLHRDLSPRNVRYTDAGAKLIDFGAISTFGASGVVGTPPCIPPEAVHGQPLDQRSDLYGLGALGYWLLTGRHAYPARRSLDLLDAWRTVLHPPSQFASDVPEALDGLIQQLLKLSALARPATAAEVIDRLNAIAGLPPGATEATEATARGYLTSAAMVGRRRELMQLRKQLFAAAQGTGSATLIEGPPGIGKTRLIQELGLEGRLAGAVAVRIELSGPACAPFGVARSVLEQIFTLAPDLAASMAAGPQAAAVRHLLEGGGGDPGNAPASALSKDGRERRAQIQQALLEFVTAFASRRTSVIVIDDLPMVDEPSLAWLALLAREAKSHRLLIVATLAQREEPNHSWIATLRDRCQRIVLQGLAADETRDLLRAWFGETARVDAIADTVYQHTAGSPLELTALAQHWVDGGEARYADGAWSLPERLDPKDLPTGVGATSARRIAGLGVEAQRLGEVLALADGRLPLDLYAEASGANEAEVFAAIDELILSGLLVSDGDAYALPQRGLIDLFAARVDPERRKVLHARLGRAWLARGIHDDYGRLAVGRHLLQGGDPRGADLLAEVGQRLIHSETAQLAIPALEAALEAYVNQGRTQNEIVDLQIALVKTAYWWDPSLAHHGDGAIVALHRASGLKLAEKVGRWCDARVAAAVGVTVMAVRYRLASARGPEVPVHKALIDLSQCSVFLAGIAASTMDQARLLRMHQVVQPLRVLPRSHIVWSGLLLVDHIALWHGGRGRDSYALGTRLLEQLADAQIYAALTAEQRREIEAGALLVAGVQAALAGSKDALLHAARLTGLGRAVDALCAAQVRLLYHFYKGDHEAFQGQRGQLDCLALKLGSHWHLDVWLPQALAAGYDAQQDAMGLKQAGEQLSQSVPTYPGFQAAAAYARGAYLRERGDFPQAVRTLETALELAPLGESLVGPYVVAALAETHLRAGDMGKAYELATDAIAVLTRLEEVRCMTRTRLVMVCALVEAKHGQAATARARLAVELDTWPEPDQCIRGMIHEALARVELEVGVDAGAAFNVHGLEAAKIYARSRNPALIARADRLVRDAQRRGVRPSATMMLGGGVEALVASNADMRQRFSALFARCPTQEEQYERALELILEQAHVERGHLYVVGEGGMRRVATWKADPPSPLLADGLRGLLRAELESEETVAEDDDVTETDMELSHDLGGEAASIAPYTGLLVRTYQAGQPYVVAVAAIIMEGPYAHRPDWEFLRALADALAESTAAQPLHPPAVTDPPLAERMASGADRLD